MINLWVGVQRFVRGEQLSAHQYVAFAALNDLLLLLTRHLPNERQGLRDGFDARRYFERAYPDIGAQLDALLVHDVSHMAAEMLEVADDLLSDVLPNYPQQTVNMLREHITAVRNL